MLTRDPTAYPPDKTLVFLLDIWADGFGVSVVKTERSKSSHWAATCSIHLKAISTGEKDSVTHIYSLGPNKDSHEDVENYMVETINEIMCDRNMIVLLWVQFILLSLCFDNQQFLEG